MLHAADAEEALSKLSQCRYRRGVRLELAPFLVDCLTALMYFFEKAYHLEEHDLKLKRFNANHAATLQAYRVGDMTRMLINVHSWTLLNISEREMRNGDIVFATSLPKGETVEEVARVVSHVAWVHAGRIWHASSHQRMGLLRDTFGEFTIEYKQPFENENGEPSRVLSFIDPRNAPVRFLQKGPFLSPSSDFLPTPNSLIEGVIWAVKESNHTVRTRWTFTEEKEWVGEEFDDPSRKNWDLIGFLMGKA